MCTLAAEDSDTWLMVDTWEAFQSYQRTAIVLDHFDHEINTVLGGVRTQDGEQRKVRVMLLAGSDLIGTMSEPGVWIYSDVCPYLISPYMLGAHHGFVAARTHPRALRLPDRRACRHGDGSGYGQPCAVAEQHSPYLAAYPKRRIEH